MSTKIVFLIVLVLIFGFVIAKNKKHSQADALHNAAASSNGTADIQKLISKGGKVDARDKKGRTPLHEACFLGHDENVKILIKNGADVNAKDYNGETPLHCAANGGMPDIAQILLEAGADINAKTNDGETAIDYVNAQIKLLEQLATGRPAEGPGKNIATYALDQTPSLLERYRACAKVLYDNQAKQ
jgi:ankyrin repeat protein